MPPCASGAPEKKVKARFHVGERAVALQKINPCTYTYSYREAVVRGPPFVREASLDTDLAASVVLLDFRDCSGSTFLS